VSPILDIQRTIYEVGRIRLGDQVGEGRSRHPRKLENFRFTSGDEDLLDACAREFGGTVREWADAPTEGTQYELHTTTNRLDVFVPPGDLGFSQWFELWSGGGCVRRCDGRTNVMTDGPCECSHDPDERECAYTTRLKVMLPAIASLGAWRVESHGYYAATELGGTVALLAEAAARGRIIPATLRIDARTERRIIKGKPVTRHFVVPVLEPRLSVLALLGEGSADGAEPLGKGPTAPTARALLEPVPPLEAPQSPSVAEVLQDTEGAEPKAKRAGTAPAIPSTGRRPRKSTGRVETVAVGEALADRAAAMADRAREDEQGEPIPSGGGFDDERAELAQRLRDLPDHIASDVRREWPNVDLPTLRRADGWTKPRIEQCDRLVTAAETRAADEMRALRERCATMTRDLGMDDDMRHSWVARHFHGLAGLTALTYSQLRDAELLLMSELGNEHDDEPDDGEPF